MTALMLAVQIRSSTSLLLATASLSVLGHDHDLTEPVMHAWNGHGAITRHVALSPHVLNGVAVGSFGEPASRTAT